MLRELRLQNYVLFEQAVLSFGPGLNVISGETGAGKSLIAGALGLALGDRIGTDVLRHEADSGSVAAVFELPGSFDPGIDLSPDGAAPTKDLLLERTFRRDQRSRLRCNDQALRSSDARQLAARLVDVSAQNEQIALADPARQLDILDQHAQLDAEREAYKTHFERARHLRRRIEANDAERRQMEARREELRELLNRLTSLAYEPTSDGALDERIERLSKSEDVRALSEEAVSLLYENEDSLQDRLGQLIRRTEELSSGCPALASATEFLQEALERLEDAVREYREALAEADVTPAELDAMVERSETIRRMARRLGCEPSEIPEQTALLKQEADELADWDGSTETARLALSQTLRKLMEAGLALRAKRIKAAASLSRIVESELRGLAMPDAGFEVAVQPLWDKEDPPEAALDDATANGLDEIVFRLSPNPGEPAAALALTASGGEMSRAMLAIKTALADLLAPPVLLFDEIDAGLGSRMGDAIADKLHALSRKRQVIAITHLPQVAAAADRHIAVRKRSVGKRTIAEALSVEGSERIEEIAQMIRGAAATQTTRKQAEEMLFARQTDAPDPQRPAKRKTRPTALVQQQEETAS